MGQFSYSFTPGRQMVLATVVLIVTVGAAYFLWYVPGKENELDLQQFRCLQNVERNVHDKVDNSLALLNILAANYDKPSRDWTKKQIASYIKQYPTDNFALNIKALPKAQHQKGPIADTKNITNKNLKSPTTSPPSTPEQKIVASDTVFTFSDRGLLIRRKLNGTAFDLHFTLEQFFKPLLSSNLFDGYMILQEPDVLYQTFPSGTSHIAADSINKDKSVFLPNQIKEITLSGTTFELFTQQIRLDGSTVVVVAGLLKKDSYDQARNKLPTPLVIVLLVLALSIVIALPWIKIYQVGGNDRLTVMDGLFCIASPILFIALLSFAFLEFSKPFRNGIDSFKISSEELAGKLSNAMLPEIAKREQLLQNADLLIQKNQKPKVFRFNHLLQGRLSELFRSDSVRELVCLDAAGNETHNWFQATGLSAPPGKYANRAYFTDLKYGTCLYVNNDKSYPYSLEPVISRVEGSFTTVMAIPSSALRKSYTIMSFDLKALRNPVVTPGFSFAVIDSTGKVLYHSEPAKQLNENLFDEFTQGALLKAATHTGVDTVFNTSYSGRQYSACAHPLPMLRYTVVVMEDEEFEQYRRNGELLFSFSMIGLYLGFLGLEALLLFLVSIKRRFYQKHYFDMSWIKPDIRFADEYRRCFFANFVLIILVIAASFFKPDFFSYLRIFLAASCFTHAFQHGRYAYLHKKIDPSRCQLKYNGLYIAAVVFLLVNAIGGASLQLIVFEIVALGLLLILFLFKSNERVFRRPNPNFFKLYAQMGFFRILLVSGLPVVLFFISVHDYQVLLEARYRQVAMAKELVGRGLDHSADLSHITLFTDGIWVNSINVDSPKVSHHVSAENLDIAKWMHNLTPGNDERLADIKTADAAPVDIAWELSSLVGPNYSAVNYHFPDGKVLHLKSFQDLTYSLPAPSGRNAWEFEKPLLFWLLLIGVLIGLWYIFCDVLQRLFALNIAIPDGWPLIDRILLKDNALNNLLFLIGPPGANKLTAITKAIGQDQLKDLNNALITIEKTKSGESGYFVARMILIPNAPGSDNGMNDSDSGGDDKGNDAVDAWNEMTKLAFEPSTQLVIVDDFDYDIKNPASNRTKLAFLEDLLQKNKAKIIIISTVHPVNFLDSLNQQKTADNKLPDGTPEHDLERWHVLLGRFLITIHSLANSPVPTKNSDEWRTTLRYETRTGKMLQRMFKPILAEENTLQQKNMTPRGLVLKVGITAHYFYMYIWQSLTKEEKFLLYDLAEDGLVNSFDDYNLVLLIGKGLVIRENGILRLFNDGFREFILTAIGQTESLALQSQIRDTGNWSKLRPSLVLLIIAVLVFLFTSQKEIYTDFLKYAAVITVGTPLVFQLFGLFKSAPKNTGS